ncbi:MAG: hypothetical protein E7403_02715 [Ruminococcaceae bacterium]|nr:hypothetical protein [Oscillospiraceae bacterium]
MGKLYTLGKDFHYVYDDEFKSSEELIEILMDIVCKGGNLALNVSPQPDGRMPKNAIKSINEFGNWLKTYGEAVFKTRPCAPYKDNDIFYTQTREFIYATAKDFKDGFIICEQQISKVEFLNDHSVVAFEKTDKGIRIKAPILTDGKFSVFKLYKELGAKGTIC